MSSKPGITFISFALILLGVVSSRPARGEMGTYCSVFADHVECRLLPVPLPPSMQHLLPKAPLLFKPRPLGPKPEVVRIGQHRYSVIDQSVHARMQRGTAAPAASPSPAVDPNPRPTIDTWREPEQTPLSRARVITKRLPSGVFRIRPLARYVARVVVVSKSPPQQDRLAQLSPVDLVFGWGVLGRPESAHCFRFRHTGRTFHIGVRSSCGLDMSYVMSHTSNNHIIPASPSVERAVSTLQPGIAARFEGYLVKVNGRLKDGSVAWGTSLSRLDRGDRSCEVFYVTRVNVGVLR
jgi:hypothetical protein